MKKIYDITYDDIISLENLLHAWREFRCGKRSKKDVQEYEVCLMSNLLELHTELKNKTYTHGLYKAFSINDPKPRDIHKARVTDRVLHHSIYRKLSPFYFKLFIADSYSCQDGKGTHRALKRFTAFHRKVPKNNTRTAFVLKCDIRKFFASIDQKILLNLLEERIQDTNVVWLLERVLNSFSSGQLHKGLPLGNLTSQLLVNIYMNEFDQYVKQTLKVKYYIRYADDFVIISTDKKYLEVILLHIAQFLEDKLRLTLHPNKVRIETISSGVDFLGWVHFPTHKVLRTASKKRMLRKINDTNKESYLGMLSHGNTHKLQIVLGKT